MFGEILCQLIVEAVDLNPDHLMTLQVFFLKTNLIGVQKENQWVDIVPIVGGLYIVVNLGDLLHVLAIHASVIVNANGMPFYR